MKFKEISEFLSLLKDFFGGKYQRLISIPSLLLYIVY